jgi:peptidoglycan/xylan/chitin deacetylase (PgdA/CDA1 family)
MFKSKAGRILAVVAQDFAEWLEFALEKSRAVSPDRRSRCLSVATRADPEETGASGTHEGKPAIAIAVCRKALGKAATMEFSNPSERRQDRPIDPLHKVGLRQRAARIFDGFGLVPIVGGMRNLFGGKLRVLAYHRVLTIDSAEAFPFDLDLVSASAAQFREQMTIVRRRYHPLTFRELLEYLDADEAPPRNALVVTFDDGYDDNYRVAFPILQELGVPAVFFVSTGYIESGMPYAYDWLVHILCTTREARVRIASLDLDAAVPDAMADRRALAAEILDRMKTMSALDQLETIRSLSEAFGIPRVSHADCRPMNWDQLREMHAAGMEIGSHGVGHHMLAKLPPAEMTHELQGSQAALTRELGVEAVSISYPVGGHDAFDDDVIAAARAASFRIGCSYVSGDNPGRPANRFDLRRIHVESDLDAAWFSAMTAWPTPFTHRAKQRGG